MQKATLKMIKPRGWSCAASAAGLVQRERRGGARPVRDGADVGSLTGGDENLSDPALRRIGRPNS